MAYRSMFDYSQPTADPATTRYLQGIEDRAGRTRSGVDAPGRAGRNELRYWLDQYAEAGNPDDYRMPGSAMIFANRMIDNNQQMPDFFGGNNQAGQGGGQRSEYVQPSYAQQENPYASRAMQLNNDPYSGQGGQNDIQNYLRNMMGNRGGGNRMGG